MWMFNMSDISIKLYSTKNIYTFPLKDISLDSVALNPFAFALVKLNFFSSTQKLPLIP